MDFNELTISDTVLLSKVVSFNRLKRIANSQKSSQYHIYITAALQSLVFDIGDRFL